MHHDFRLVQRLLHRLSCLENLGEFLERAAPRLDEEEVDEDEFEYVPEDEKEIILNRRVS
jgi:hypothetical protein